MKTILTDINNYTEVAKPFQFLDGKLLNEEAATELNQLVADLKEVLNNTPNLLALSAPQIGTNVRVFGIKFDNLIKIFINPIIKIRSKDKFVNVEKTVDDKTAVIFRPVELEIAYYTEELKYEDNKLVGPAAAIFMQQYNIIDNILPGSVETVLSKEKLEVDDLPTILDASYSSGGIIIDSVDDLPEELAETTAFLAKLANVYEDTYAKLLESDDENIKKVAKMLKMQEKVIVGDANFVDYEGWQREKQLRRAQKKQEKIAKQAQLKSFLANKH
jgi:peptide deformylase